MAANWSYGGKVISEKLGGKTKKTLLLLKVFKYAYLFVYLLVLSASASQILFLLPFVFNLPEFIILPTTLPET